MSEFLWGILGNVVAYYLIIYVFPLIGGLLMGFLIGQKENLWKAALAGLVCCTCLLVVSNILASRYDEFSKNPIPVAYEEILVPHGTGVGIADAITNKLISQYGDNLSATVSVKDNTIAYRMDGGMPTVSTFQQAFPGDRILLQSASAIKNFRAIGISGTAPIGIEVCKGRLR
jgi:hypothetical protein